MHPVARARLEAANTLCIALHGCGEPGQAAAVVESTLTACEAELGQDHPQTLTALNNVAQAYWYCFTLARFPTMTRQSRYFAFSLF